MKILSKKLLFYLHSSSPTEFVSISAEDVPLLLSDLSSSGQRSLLHWLKKQGFLDQVVKNHQTHWFLTQFGKQTLEQQLPVFRPGDNWQGKWQVLIFRQGPQADKHFNLLRPEVLKNGGLMVSRGVYAFAQAIPDSVWVKCEQEYLQNISLLESSQWLMGDVRDIAIEYFGLTDVSEAYSSISRELLSLLESKYVNKVLNYQSKTHIYSLYSRFFAILCEDTGLVRYYFPQTPHWRDLLRDFHSLLAV